MKSLVYSFIRCFPYYIMLGGLVSCFDLAGPNISGPGSIGKTIMVSIPDTISTAVDDSLGTDSMLYEQLTLHLVHNTPGPRWPVKTPYPLPGSILPFKRIVAYYGNLYSTGMGILGELPPQQMLQQLSIEVRNWEQADSLIPVQPALHYIAVTAQCNPGPGAKYRLRMPGTQIEKILALARQINAIVFLDIQVGHSTLQEEIPALEKYLLMPDVHLGIDPEYSMKYGQVPCTAIGTFDAADINFASSWLASLVEQHQLPPKILVVHRFTQAMVTNYKAIKLHPEVQIVMNMDGFGSPAKKLDSYKGWIANQPVQFAGFKLFYKNDVVTGKHLMKPSEVLKLYPSPIYIQYQ